MAKKVYVQTIFEERQEASVGNDLVILRGGCYLGRKSRKCEISALLRFFRASKEVSVAGMGPARKRIAREGGEQTADDMGPGKL